MVNEDENILNVTGSIVIFSFVSIIFVFISLVIVGSYNNYVLQNLYDVGNTLIADGIIHPSISPILETTANSLLQIVPYLDYVWLISFIGLFIGSLLFSYFAKRENFFGIFNFAVLGIIIFTYVGGIFIQLTTWFQDNILSPVFPEYASSFPFFVWYLDNVYIINLFLISLCVVANFIHIDFTKYNTRKDGEDIEQI